MGEREVQTGGLASSRRPAGERVEGVLLGVNSGLGTKKVKKEESKKERIKSASEPPATHNKAADKERLGQVDVASSPSIHPSIQSIPSHRGASSIIHRRRRSPAPFPFSPLQNLGNLTYIPQTHALVIRLMTCFGGFFVIHFFLTINPSIQAWGYAG